MVAPAPDTSRAQLEKKARFWSSNKELHPTLHAFAQAEDAPWIVEAEHIQITSVVTNDAHCEKQSQSIVTMIGTYFVIYLSIFPTLAQETSKYAKCESMAGMTASTKHALKSTPFAQLRAFCQCLLLLPLRPVVPLPWRWGSVHGRDNNLMLFGLRSDLWNNTLSKDI